MRWEDGRRRCMSLSFTSFTSFCIDCIRLTSILSTGTLSHQDEQVRGMTSPFGAGQLSPRMIIKLNPPHANGNGDGDTEMNDHSPSSDVKGELVGSPAPAPTAPASEAGPSRAMSHASRSPERPSPAPSTGMLDRSFGAVEPAPEPYSQPHANGSQPEATLKAPVLPESKSKSHSKPATPTANGSTYAVFVSGQKTHRKVSCELCHRRKIKVGLHVDKADGSVTKVDLPAGLAPERARSATTMTTQTVHHPAQASRPPLPAPGSTL